MARQTTESWIDEAIADPDKDGRKLTALMLVQMIGMQRQEVHTIKFGDQARSSKDMAKLFQRKAENKVQDLHGVHTFNLLGFYERDEHEASHTIVINSNPDNAGNVTEGATPAGVALMAQRHGEMLIQQVYRRQQVLDDYSMGLIREQGQIIRSLQRENLDAVGIIKQVIFDQAANSHKYKMEQLTYERSTGERAKFMKFAPALVNSLLGREIFPQNVEDTALLESIAENITEEQIEKLMSMNLPMEVAGPLVIRFTKYMEKKKAAQDATKQLNALNTGEKELD